jgi:Cof subfamily protein (haloacid dehalogenase superfamily)
MPPKLLAFDLDGTLLTEDKRLSDANRAALADMVACGSRVALASGRLRHSMMRYAADLPFDVAMLTLNGAAVYTTADGAAPPVSTIDLPLEYAGHLLRHAAQAGFALNFYHDDKLYTLASRRTAAWNQLYVSQTSSVYTYVDDFGSLAGIAPSKIIFVGEPAQIDAEEKRFRSLWGAQVYIVRTWDYYLEFLNRDANKGAGIRALAKAFAIPMEQVAAFGDAANDIPMIEVAGYGIAMKNATAEVKAAARRVTRYTNDEDGVAREWEELKKL